jgi:DNA-binding CsgD family transcriptional regulator
MSKVAWAMRKWYATIYGSGPAISASLLMPSMASPHPSIKPLQEHAVAMLSGWVASITSLAHNKRLESALAGGESSPTEELLNRLPAAVIEEWATLNNAEPEPTFFRNLVVRRLEAEGREMRVGSDPVELRPGGVDEFSTVEEAGVEEVSPLMRLAHQAEERQLIEELTNRANPSPQQREILDLLKLEERLLKGNGDIAAEEIAAILGTSANQVSVQWRRIKTNLREARGA